MVGPAVEFPDVGGFGVGISPAVDFLQHQRQSDLPEWVRHRAGSSFDGWVFRVLGGAPAIAGVSLAGTNIAGLTAAALSFDATSIRVNTAGLGPNFQPDSFISTDVRFAPSRSRERWRCWASASLAQSRRAAVAERSVA